MSASVNNTINYYALLLQIAEADNGEGCAFFISVGMNTSWFEASNENDYPSYRLPSSSFPVVN